MKQLASFFLLLISALSANAQIEYSYVNDAQFYTAEDLYYYTFTPNEEFLPIDDLRKNLNPGDVKFQLTPGMLLCEFDGERSSFNMTSINPEEYGFRVELMNAQDPSKQGHLKVIFNNNKQVDALAFRAERKLAEFVFFMKPMPGDRILRRDLDYFSDVTDVNGLKTQYLFGQTVKPFLETGRTKRRIYPRDSVSFTFVEKEMTSGKKTKVEQLLTFKFGFENDDEEFEVKEQTFIIKKISEGQVRSPFGNTAYQLELKDGPSPVTLFLTPQKTVAAINFGGSIWQLRDKRYQGDDLSAEPPKSETLDEEEDDGGSISPWD